MKDRTTQIHSLLEDMNTMKRCMPFHGGSRARAHTPRITPSQWGVVMRIGQHGTLSMKEVGKALHMTSSAVTQLVDGLVTSGYVERKENEEDRRTVMLSLSKKTRTQVDKMKANMVQRFLEAFSVLTDKEFEQFCVLQRKVAEGFSNNA